MLRLIGNPKNGDAFEQKNVSKTVHIYDARPKKYAMGNKFHGGGFEYTDYYKNCDIFFMEIDNIHFVRESYRKVTSICQQ